MPRGASCGVRPNPYEVGMMPVYNPLNPNRRLSRTSQENRCDGCGRVLPKGSYVLIWSVWRFGRRRRLRFCSGCQSVIYGCDERRSIDMEDESELIRCFCESCDSFPVCDRVEFLKGSRPGDIYFGDLRIGGCQDADNPSRT